MLDRAWDDKWALNASYTLSYAEGNAEGPVTSDFNFADSGRTEAFDDPYVNFGGDGYLPSDRRHQIKLRGAYALTPNWQFGATLAAASGRPKSALGLGNPIDGQAFHSFFVCTSPCGAPGSRVYELNPRGSEGRTPWTYDMGLNVTFNYGFSAADLSIKLAVYNVFNQETVIETDERLETAVGARNPQYGIGTGYQNPRYATLTMKLDF